MGRFYPMYIRRSDGVLEVTAKHGKREKNEPTAEQLNSTPDAKGVSDFYRLLSPSDAKYTDWMKKLAGMLIRELGDGQLHGSDKSYLLYELPKNYRLYEHIKTKAQPTGGDGEGEVKTSKNHAGGNNERQDAYLYGHPLGRKKRYRSPGDFFPHLLWLATDTTGDPDNCSCKVCSPDELQPEEEKIKPEPVKVEGGESRSIAPATTSLSQRPISQAAQAALAAKMGLSAASMQPLTPSAVRQARTIDQQLDTHTNNFLYRQGELVWYFRGQAWGLAIVVRRYHIAATDNSPQMRCYYVQPLSHPFEHIRQVPILQEDNMRPWLAWSPPSFTLKAFNQAASISYESIDWQAVLNGQFGHSDPQVDGSILAARAIDGAYNLFGPIEGNNSQERHWNGMFFGSEKIWVGDIVRLKVGSGRDILVVTDIVDRPQQGIDASTTQLIGDTYQPIDVPAGTPLPSDAGQLPRMREDMARRSAITGPTRRVVSFWKLTSTNARVGVESVKGRWYEATLLLPILQGSEEYGRRCAGGDIADSGNWMNARGDAQTVDALKEAPVAKRDRLSALRGMVPDGTMLGDGIDAPPPDEIAEVVRRVSEAGQRGQQPELPLDDEMIDYGGDAGGHAQQQNVY